MSRTRIPTATYRLQLHAGFTFSQVSGVVSYLWQLGISDIYASPLFKARRGSLHGYSVTNPLELNLELGSRASFDALGRKLRSHKMGLLLDVVPNHMALSKGNPWWQDVLENGQSSPYAVFFDIDWQPPCRTLAHKVLIPVLGRPYGQCLEDQELTLELTPEGFVVNYYDHSFPLDLHSYLPLLTHRLDELKNAQGEESPDVIRIMGVITLVQNLPPRTTTGAKKRRERLHWRDVTKKSLWLLYEHSPRLREFLDENLRIFNGRRGDPASFDLLDNLLREQPYRLAHWLVSLEVINYRRFFSINDLIGIRVEDPQVFEATHNLLFKLVEEDKVTGLRLDHIDGLYDPAGYVQRLQDRLQAIKKTEADQPFYVVVEKILEAAEQLPEDWAVGGTTGYDFLGLVNNLFVQEAGLRELERLYHDFTATTAGWRDVVYDQKKYIMASLFGGEVRSLEEELVGLAARDRHAMDVSRQDLLQALIEVTACLPVYRTYVSSYDISARDRGYVEEAVAEARRRQPVLGELALLFLRQVLLLDFQTGLPEEHKKAWLRFVCRWQQFTGPIMAKGLEDTAAYVYNPLVSLNDVGGFRYAVGLAEFHSFNEMRQRRWPTTMNATSTHDTKRSEDVRARLNVLSEMPEVWGQKLNQWRRWNAPKKKTGDGGGIPDPNEEIFLYQTLLGAWPLQEEEVPEFQDRLKEYLVKALREAKVHSLWHNPHQEYEQVVLEFVAAILRDDADNEFLPDFLDLQGRLAYYGALNSLSQVLLKATVPGVPDFYQGNELWDFSLVDPDNRRPVDFKLRQKLLKELMTREARGDAFLLPELLAQWRDGRLKMFLTHKALQIRRGLSALFLEGDYLPLTVSGPQGDRVVAFARKLDQEWVLVLAARFYSQLTEPETLPLGERVWGGNFLMLPEDAPGNWRETLTGSLHQSIETGDGQGLPLAEVFRYLPVALLTVGNEKRERGL